MKKRYEYKEDEYVTCRKCGNCKAYEWFDSRLRIKLISCDECGVYDVGGSEV